MPQDFDVVTPDLRDAALEKNHEHLRESIQRSHWASQSQRLDRGKQPLPPYAPKTMRRASAPSALLCEKTVLESSKSSAAGK
jgi:hypothetical protein